MRKLFGIGSLAVLMLVVSAQGTRAQVVKLGVLRGMTWSDGYNLNETGDVVGVSGNDGGLYHGFFVKTKGPQAFQMIDLGTSPNIYSAGEEVNNFGLVVGWEESESKLYAFAWSPHLKAKIDLGALPGHTHSFARAVCDIGLIAGTSISSDWNDWRPVVWTPDRAGKTWTIHELNTVGLEQVTEWSCWAINNAGQIVGDGWDTVEGKQQPVVWNPAKGEKEWQPTKLETPSDYPSGGAGDINECGEVVGWVAFQDGSLALPALWQPANPRRGPWKLTILPTLADPPIGFNNIDEINDVGDMVGSSVDSAGAGRAVRWRLSDLDVIYLLGYPGVSSYGGGVSNSGIVGGWYNDGGHDHAVIKRFRSK